MFKKILIANRGEIAVRIIRACRDMNIISVAVYSTADREALHTQIADEAICIGSELSANSYLNAQNIISAALGVNADAIHPGFGFLSENAEFAKMCIDNNIIFIGPNPETILLMGDKSKAREMAIKAGVPVIQGSDGILKDEKDAMKLAREIGYPVMIKASSGGGGKGIRVIENDEDLKKSFNAAKGEALANFGDDRLYMEKYIMEPRHIEVQILGDSFGNIVHLFERECSIQRKHQKLIEESPSVFIDDETRDKLGKCAVNLAQSVGYVNAGTIEFLMDKYKNFYFCEMNTRIQVEHPVTELVTGIDLIVMQIKIAFGGDIGLKQEDISIKGWAIECRINAEDCEKNFMPMPGTIVSMHLAGGPGIRIDTAVYQGYTVTPFYDSMIGKLIAYGNTREEAINRMKRALSEMLFYGITTNVDYQMSIINSKKFLFGTFSTNSIEKGEF